MSQQATTFTTNTTGTVLTVPDGGRILLVAAGTWGSGSLALEGQDPNDAWQDLVTALTADGTKEVVLPKGESIDVRLNFTGGTGQDVDAWLIVEEA